MSGLQPKILAFDVTATTEAAALKSDDDTFREEVTIFADKNNTDGVKIGASDSQTFPLEAGYWVTVKKTALNLIYYKSDSGSQTLHVILGGN